MFSSPYVMFWSPLICSDPFWSVKIRSDLFWSIPICSDSFRSVLIRSDMFRFILIHFNPTRSNLIWFPISFHVFHSVPILFNLLRSVSIHSNYFQFSLICFDLLWSYIALCSALCCGFREKRVMLFFPSHMTWWLESFQDFLIKLDMKPCMYLVEISIFH